MLAAPAHEKALIEFRQKHESGDANSAMQWLGQQRQQPHDIVVLYNHPSRKDLDAQENLDDYARWTENNDVLIGFEGGPGHQRGSPRGDYFEKLQTVDGWDPIAATVGGGWDQLLDAGMNPWAALASSDFHSGSGDFAPCEFSRTHVLVPEISENGILMGLRAGAFWAQMGPFLDQLDFSVTSPGLIVPAVPGESFQLGSVRTLNIHVALQRHERAAEQTITVSLIR